MEAPIGEAAAAPMSCSSSSSHGPITGGDFNVAVLGPRVGPAECKVWCPRISSGHVSRVQPGSENDSGFDALVAHQWREHLRGLHPEVAERKRWKSGYWWNWYNELILTVDDSYDDGPTSKNESILEKKFVHFDDDD